MASLSPEKRKGVTIKNGYTAESQAIHRNPRAKPHEIEDTNNQPSIIPRKRRKNNDGTPSPVLVGTSECDMFAENQFKSSNRYEKSASLSGETQTDCSSSSQLKLSEDHFTPKAVVGRAKNKAMSDLSELGLKNSAHGVNNDKRDSEKGSDPSLNTMTVLKGPFDVLSGNTIEKTVTKSILHSPSLNNMSRISIENEHSPSTQPGGSGSGTAQCADHINRTSQTAIFDVEEITTKSGYIEMSSQEAQSSTVVSEKYGAIIEGSLSLSPVADSDNVSKHEEVRFPRSLRVRKPLRLDLDEPLPEVMKPLTVEERQAFSGWVEVESDPALFEYILQRNGVKDIRIQEIYDLQAMAGSIKSSQTHGVIFLFQYGDNDAQEHNSELMCPKEIWFANQVVDYACATVALMNIVMNSKRLDLGDQLTAFRQRTLKMKPVFRGRALGNDNFIRTNHNSFMRRIEMLNANLCLQQESAKHDKMLKAQAKRRHKQPTKGSAGSKTRATNPKTKKKSISAAEDGFHYIAFVPVDGFVWRFDGLLQHPVNIGSYTNDWLAVAQSNIEARINCGDQTHFNLMVLCDNPLQTYRKRIAELIKSILEVEARFKNMKGESRLLFELELGCPVNELMALCGLVQTDIDDTQIPDDVEKSLEKPTIAELLTVRRTLARDQVRLESEYMAEVSRSSENEEVVARHLHDLTSEVYTSTRELSGLGYLKDLAREVSSAAEGSSPQQMVYQEVWEDYP